VPEGRSRGTGHLGHEAGGGTLTDHFIEGTHAARSTLGGSPFPPIADHGFLSDCEVSALLAPSGNVEWMCLPRMDGPSVFAAMLDRGAGSFRLGPADVMVPAGRRYLPGTMVLDTTWSTGTGWAVARDVELFRHRWPHAVQTLIAGRYPAERATELILGRPTGIKTVIAFGGQRTSGSPSEMP
jgi:hypothetical protein